MKQQIYFLIIMFLPVLLFGQARIDSTIRVFPTITSSEGSTTYQWTASYIVFDSVTAAANRKTTYQQQKIKRDTAKTIEVSRDSIRQDNKIVGYYKFSAGVTEIYTSGGFLIAKAFNSGDKNWRINTFSDGKRHEMISTGFFETDIATFVVKQGYL